ncbi:MAG TPA: hypothetical protein VKA32_04430 [Gammaproteobacteria bacterium]|nr:hypothetical protein [Gammaproteobacteria bacterium]
MKRVTLSAFLMFSLAGCAAMTSALTGTPTPAARAAYVKKHPEIPDRYKKAIKDGQIMEGMSKDEVRASWGDPCGLCYGTTSNSWGDSWEYGIPNSASTGQIVYFDPSGSVTGWSN